MAQPAANASRALPDFIRRSAVRISKARVEPIDKWHIVKGDTVAVLGGSDKGKTGKVLKVLRKENRVLVQGVNMVSKAVRAGMDASQKGGIIKVEQPIHYSQVNLVDPATGRPTRISLRYTETGEKVRVSKRSGSIIAKPAELKTERKLRPAQPGPKDTSASVAAEQTFFPDPSLASYLGRGGALWTPAASGTVEAKPEVLSRVNFNRRLRNRIVRHWQEKLDMTKVVELCRAAEGAAPAAAPLQ